MRTLDVFKEAVDNREWFNLNRKRIMKFFGVKECVNCGVRRDLHVHHIVPLSKGGRNKISNLCLVCKDCHATIHDNEHLSKFGTKKYYKGKPLSEEITFEKLRDLRIENKLTVEQVAEIYGVTYPTISYYEEVTGFKETFGTIQNFSKSNNFYLVLDFFRLMKSGERIKSSDAIKSAGIPRTTFESNRKSPEMVSELSKLGITKKGMYFYKK